MGFCSQEVSPVSHPVMICFSHFSAKRQHCFAKRSLRPLEPVIFNELESGTFEFQTGHRQNSKETVLNSMRRVIPPLNFKVNWLGFENPYLLRLVKDEIVTEQLRFISVVASKIFIWSRF